MGAARHRKLAAALKHDPAAWIARLQAARTGSLRTSLCRLAGCAYPTGADGQANAGAKTDPELTFQPDQSGGGITRAIAKWGAMPTHRGA